MESKLRTPSSSNFISGYRCFSSSFASTSNYQKYIVQFTRSPIKPKNFNKEFSGVKKATFVKIDIMDNVLTALKYASMAVSVYDISFDILSRFILPRFFKWRSDEGPESRRQTNNNVQYRQSDWMEATALNGIVQEGDIVEFLRIYDIADFPQFFRAIYTGQHPMPNIAPFEKSDSLETFTYNHTAICVGKDGQGNAIVVGFNDMPNPAGGGKARVRICQQTLEEVAAGSHCRFNNSLDEQWVPLDNEAVSHRALKALRPDEQPPYKLATFNCQHFSNQKRYDVVYSAQAEIITDFFKHVYVLCNSLIFLKAGHDMVENTIMLFVSLARIINCFHSYKKTRSGSASGNGGDQEREKEIVQEIEKAMATIPGATDELRDLDNHFQQMITEEMAGEVADFARQFNNAANEQGIEMNGTLRIDLDPNNPICIRANIRIALQQLEAINVDLKNIVQQALPAPVPRPALPWKNTSNNTNRREGEEGSRQ